MLAIIGLLLSSFSIKELYVIYICWVIWFGAFFCGTASLKAIKDFKGFLWSRLLANAGCALSVISFLGVTFIINDIHVIDSARCRGNIFVLGKSIRAYCEKHNGEFPEASKWCDLLVNSVNDIPGFSKHSFNYPPEQHSFYGFSFNKNIYTKKLNEVDPNVVLVFESEPGWNQFSGREMFTLNRTRHLFSKRGGYVLLAEKNGGQVKFVTRNEEKNLRWKP
jgi:hypothetical protein